MENDLFPASVTETGKQRTGLCGVAATCKAMVEYDPSNFVTLALSLYQNGRAGDIIANQNLFNNSLSSAHSELN